MKKLLVTFAIMACLNGQAYKPRLDHPTLFASCQSCDSTQLTPWGDGTNRFIVALQGDGYDPKTYVRLTWLRNDGVAFSFDIETDAGSWSCVWTDLPVGDYTVSASQPVNRFKFQTITSLPVQIF